MQVRLLTYPSTFTWIGEEEVETTMQSLANHLQTLESLVSEEDIHGENQRAIVSELTSMEFAATMISVRSPKPDLGSNLPETNHLLIDEHMEEFQQSIYQAIVQAEATPPVYFGVGKLMGSCSGCHRYR